MLSPTQALVNYGGTLGTIFVAATLFDWTLDDRRRRQIADGAARLWGGAAALRRRWLLDKLASAQVRRALVATVFVAEALLFGHLAQRMGYGSRAASARDAVIGDFLLFVTPFCIAALALFVAGPRLVARLIGAGNLFACTAKCLAAALAADLLGYGALQTMNATFLTFGPRALLDWWDARLWLYAAEYAVSGVIVSAMTIASVLLAICAAAGLATLIVVLALLQAELLARVIRRYPKPPLLGSSTALAGLALILKDWM